MYPKVSIIILNWNGLSDTIECLESLKKITYPNYEVIVVDNGSKGNDADILEERYKGYIRIIRNKENLGFAGGNNVAIKEVLEEKKSKYILLLNNDTVVESNFLEEMVNIEENDEKIGIIGSKIYYYNFNGKKNILRSCGAEINLWLGRLKCYGMYEKDQNQYDKLREVSYIEGACLLIKQEVIEKIGLLDENYFLYFEETDWCMTTKKAGYKVVANPRSRIWHKAGKTSKKISGLQTYYLTRNLFLFEKKHTSILQFSLFILYYFLVSFPLRIIYYSAKKDFKNYLLGLKDGICGYKGKKFFDSL